MLKCMHGTKDSRVNHIQHRVWCESWCSLIIIWADFSHTWLPPELKVTHSNTQNTEDTTSVVTTALIAPRHWRHQWLFLESGFVSNQMNESDVFIVNLDWREWLFLMKLQHLIALSHLFQLSGALTIPWWQWFLTRFGKKMAVYFGITVSRKCLRSASIHRGGVVMESLTSFCLCL